MRRIAVILVFLLLIQAVPIDTFNYGESTMTINKLVSMSEAELSALTDKQIFEAITSSDNYPHDTDGTLSYDGRTRKERVDLNISSFRKYRQIIYGVPFEKQSNYPGKVIEKSEPKYLGFNVDGDPMTNDKYPGANLGVDPPEKKWIVKTNQYIDTWDSFRDSSDSINELYNHILKTDTINSDSVGKYNLQEILKKTDGMDNLSSYIGNNNEILRKKLGSVAKLQTIPTFFSQGSFVMKHKHNKTIYYDTMEWESIKSFNGSITVEPEHKKLILLPGQDEISNNFKVTLNYNDWVSGGMETNKLLPELIDLKLDTQYQEVNKSNPTYTFTKTYHRNELAKFGIDKKSVVASTSFDTLVGDEFGYTNSAEFEIDVKLKGDIIADFVLNGDGAVRTDAHIQKSKGMWDSSDDTVNIELTDASFFPPDLLKKQPNLKIISWNWYILNNSGDYELLNTTLKPTISKSVSFGSDYSKDGLNEKGRLESKITFKLEVMDSEGNTDEAIHYVTVSCNPPDKPLVPVEKNKPPTAKMKIRKTLKAGQNGKANGTKSYDEDGHIVDYHWDIYNAEYVGGSHGDYKYFYVFDLKENAKAELEVKDNSGDTDSCEEEFDIVNPITPVIGTYGALKENRKVNISGYRSTGTEYFPIDWDKTEWKITPLDGQKKESIKVDGSMSGKEFDVLFKETGQYKIWLKLYTTCTYPYYDDVSYFNETEKIITIAPDEKPITNIALRKMVYRNPDTDGKAVLNMADTSISPDDDIIAHRKWSYAFDSDNDGSFDDEDFNVASDENEVMIQIEVNKVGKYLIKLEITEEFGQPTIEKFVTAEDRRRDDNTDIPRVDRTSEVLNVAPTVELNFDERKQVDLILLTDYEGQDLMDLRDQVESLTMRLQEQKVDAKIYIFDNLDASNRVTIGKYNDPIYEYKRKAVFSWMWSEVEHWETNSKTSTVLHKQPTQYNVLDNEVYTIASRTGTEKQAKSFPEYPNAYGTYKYLGTDPDNNNLKKEYLYDIKIYDDLGDLVIHDDDYKIQYFHMDRDRRGRDKYEYNGIKNFKFTIDKKFYPYGIKTNIWKDNNPLNTDKIKDIALSDNSDRYLITSVKDRKSLTYLDKNFSKYIKDNNIVVAASINDIAREFYADYYDFDDVKITERAVYVKTPYGLKFKIGDSNGDASYLELTREDVAFSQEGSSGKLKTIKRTPNTSTGSGSVEFGQSESNINNCYGYYSLADNGVLKFYYTNPVPKRSSSRVYSATYSNTSKPVDTDVKSMYLVYSERENSNIIYEKNDGTWHMAMVNRTNRTAGGKPYWDYRFYGVISSVSVKDLDVDKVKSISTKHILGENGNMYFFDKVYTYVRTTRKGTVISTKTYDFRCRLFSNVNKTASMGSYIIYVTNDSDKLKKAYTSYGNNSLVLNTQTLYNDRDVDLFKSYNDTTIILFKDNTIVGGGRTDYCQVGIKSDSLVGLRYIYQKPVTISDEYKTREFIPPIELVTDDIRNLLYDEGENDKLCEEIYNIYKKEDTDSAYILLGTKANMKTFYSDYENDDLYDYRWDVVHNEKYFENDLGKDPRAKLDGLPIEVFDYTGHYKIDLKVQDNPVAADDRFDNYRLWNKDETTLNVFVHRKPRVRDGLYAKKTDGKLHVYAVDEGSFDLDHLSQSNKGIRSHDWYWRTDRNRIWINDKLDLRDAEYNTTYYISHRVKDEEGVWSDFSSKEIIIGEDIPVVLSANIDAYMTSKFDINSIPVDEKIKVKDIKVTYYGDVNLLASLEKDGTVIKELLNKDSNTTGVSKNDTGFTYEDIVEKLPHNLDDGDYSVRIVASDLSDMSKTAMVNLPFKINTPINLRAILPEQAVIGETAEISSSSSVYTDKVKLIAFNDDASIRKVYDMTLKETNSTRKIWTADVDIPWSCKDQDYEFKFVGTIETDTPKSEELIEDMRIVVLEIAEIGIKGYWNHWRGQENMFGERMTTEPHRFLSHETVIIYGYIAGNPDKVSVEFSPQLQAMFFTDPAGNEYSYEEDLGYTVDFPLEMPLEKWRYYEVEYQLPIAWMTLDWDNSRLRNSYWMKVTAEKSGVKVSEQFDDIEITGTVYDLLYVQPYHKPEK